MIVRRRGRAFDGECVEGVLTQARINDDYEIMKNLGTSAMRFLGLGEEMAA